MEIKRCLLTKTTNENSTFAIYPKTSADLVDMGQEEDAITVKERFEQIEDDGIWDNKTFTYTKMYPKVEGCGDEENHPNIDDFGGGWWDQVKGNNVGSVYTPLIQHQRRLIETPNMNEAGVKTSLPKRVAPTLRIQNYLTYNHKGFLTNITNNNIKEYDAENICRIVNEYHELIADGKVLSTNDKATPNFTPVGIFSHNRFKGPAGMCALFGRVKDVYYTNEELQIPGTNPPEYYPASKSCAAGFYVQRLSNYNQGRKGVSYSIALETWTENLAQEDGLLGTEGYYGDEELLKDRDAFNYKTWTCGYHLIGSGRRPITAGIFIEGTTTAKEVYNNNIGNSSLINKDVRDVNGDLLTYNGMVSSAPDETTYTRKTIQNGMYNGILIGSSAMLVGGKPSPNTVGINMASWTKVDNKKRYGYSAIRIGYAPRFLSARGPAYFEAPAFKFLNRNGNMPVAITCRKTPYIDPDDSSNIRYYRPSLIFKQGADVNSNNIDDVGLERPNDEPVAYMAYNPVPSDEYFVIKSNNSLKFVVNNTFNTIQNNNNLESDDNEPDDDDDRVEKNYHAVYKYQNDKYFGNLIKRENDLKENQGIGPTSYPTLGSDKYPWQTIYLSSSPMIQVGNNIYSHSTISDNNNDFKSVISINDHNEPYFANGNKIMKAWDSISISDLAKCVYTVKRTNNPDTYDNKPHFLLNVEALRSALSSVNSINSYSFIQNTYDIGDNDGSPSAYSVDYNQIFLLEMIYNRVKNINRDKLLTNITNVIGEINDIGTDSNGNINNNIIAKLNNLETRIIALENAQN